MPVTYLELENFKSYAGVQRIGPFFNFSCVIGPNGSGKSNLMDAMSFVLGVQSRDLRSSQMKDLIFRPPGSARDENLTAKASLVYVEPDKKKGDATSNTDEEEEGESPEKKAAKKSRLSQKMPMGKTIIFSRLITSKGTGEYQVNGKSVTFKQYEAKLASIGVLLKARNFLVFQGDVETMARKNPKQLVEMFENISGSSELKEEYEVALRAKEEAEQRTIFAFNKTKEHKSERRVLKEQKEEAERFHSLLQQRTALKTNHFLWLLFHIHSDVQLRETAVTELQESLSEHQVVVAEKEGLLKKAKKEASKARSQSSAKDKLRIKLEAEVDKLQPSVIESSEAIAALKKRVASDTKAVTRIEKEKTTHSDKLAVLEEEIEEYQSKEEELQNEYDQLKQSESGGIGSLTEEQEVQYEKIRDAAAVASAPPRRKLQSAVRGLESARAGAVKVAEEKKELQGRKEDAQRSCGELTARKETLEKSLEKTRAELSKSESTLQTLQKTASDYQAKRSVIESQLDTIQNTLRQAKDDRRKDKEEERILSAIAALKRHFPGVRGRLVDLCRPSQQRYNLAVTVAGGKDMDAIVVDTKRTAFDCIKYLRDQRIGTATFLPLDSLQIPSAESTERLRAMAEHDKRYRLAVDVIRVGDESNRRAVLYAVGNTVVCDELNVAREICFQPRGGRGGEERIKAVTLKGAVISKAGTMTGGVTRDDVNKAGGRWSDQKLEELRSKKEALEVEKETLDSEAGRGSGSHTARAEDLRNTIGNLRNKEQYSKSDLEYTKKKLKEQVTLLKSSSKTFAKLEKATTEAEEGVTEANERVERHRQEVRDVEEEHFAPFREETGISDLRAYDEAIGKAREDFVKNRTDIREHLAKLTAKKKYEDEKDFDSKLAKALKKKTDHESQLEEAEETEEKLQSEVSEIKAKLADAESTLKQAHEAEQEKEEVVREARSSLKEAEGDYNKVNKTMSAEESDLMVLRQKLHETLQKARVDEVELPMLDAEEAMDEDEEEPEDSQMSESATRSSSRRSSSQSASQETNASLSEHFSQREAPNVSKDRREAGKVDFSTIDEDLKVRRSASEEEKLRKKFESKISKLTQEIEGIAPNMKASDAFNTMTELVKTTVDDFNTAKEDGRRANETFNKVRKARSHKFNSAFKQIDAALKIIYTDMTKSSKHPLGGNAYLSLDDSDEPYRGGMKFNAMPPMKRFRDMEQLSGGEKTVAALSLLFAIHSYRPAPFFIMDEVDAALDNVNVLKVCNYIRQRSDDFQCIVISLKDMFYERSESLVGIARDVSSNSSRTLTLDLTKFDRKSSGGDKRSRGGENADEAESPKKPRTIAAGAE